MSNRAKRAPMSSLRLHALRLGPAAALLAVPILLFAPSGCSSDDESPASGCVPGAQQTCLIPGCTTSTQECAEDGQSFEACVCMDGAGGSSMGGSSMDPDTAPAFTSATGSACASSADCFGGMTCLNEFPDGGDGQVAGGYCALACQSDSDCTAVDGAAFCSLTPSSDGNRYCLGVCLLDSPLCGTPPGTTAGRIDMACQPATNLPQSVGLCVPRCLDDENCGDGLFCDLGTGECVTEIAPGAAIAAACTADEACASSLCLKADPSDATEVGFCSGVCNAGEIRGCGFGLDVPEGERAAGCLFFAAAAGNAGLCAALCDDATDCGGDLVCDPLPDVLSEAWDRVGACIPPAFLDNNAEDAGAPASDAGAPASDASTTIAGDAGAD